MSLRLTLLQISDLHWSISDRLNKGEIASLQTTIKGLLNGITSGDHMHSRVGTENILLLNGDMVGRGDWRSSVQQMFRKMLLEPLITKTAMGLKWDYLISVPGNHDASPKLELRQSDRLNEFTVAAQNVQRTLLNRHGGEMVTPFSLKPYCLCLNERVYIRTFNSASLCGAPNLDLERQITEWQTTLRLLDTIRATSPANPVIDSEIERERDRLNGKIEKARKEVIKPLSPAVITSEEMDACEEELRELNPPIRMAVLHHNTLNFPGDDVSSIRFFNQTAFNSWLIRNRFHIVFHGHQHDLVLRKYDEAHGSEVFQGDEGFFSVGATEMDVLGTNTPGYSIVTFDVPDSGKIARLKVARYTHHKSTGEHELRETEADVIFSSPTSTERTLGRKTKRVILEGRCFEAIRRALDDPEDRSTHTDSFMKTLDGDSWPLGMYALSVFGSQKWFGNKIMEFQMPYAVDNLLRRVAMPSMRRSKGNPGTITHHVSAPVAKAIGNAMKNGELLREVREQLRAKGIGVPEYDDLIRRSWNPNACSLSVFGHRHVAHSPHVAPLSLIVSGSDTDGEQPLRDREHKVRVREAVRVLFWDKEDLLLPSAFDIIRTHEILQIPLFWLDRASLVARDGHPREKIGYFMYYTAPRKKDGDYRPHQWMFDSNGVQANLEEGLSRAWRGDPPQFLNLEPKASLWDEYQALLRFPGLQFAIDAWSTMHVK